MNTITPFYVMVVFLILIWLLDDVLLFFAIELSLVMITFNQSDFFGTIPTSMTNNFYLLWLSILMIAFAKHGMIAMRVRAKYNSIKEN